MKGNRLYFIDAVRAFAILMMLQGHFTHTLLAPSYRDSSNIFFQVWTYFRGITAPIFFTISGLIFTYLLLKAKQRGTLEKRMRKGFIRGMMLIGIGYVLRINIFDWLHGKFYNSIFIIDVLQCIGFSLIILVISYQLMFRKTRYFSILMLVLGVSIFITEPLYRFLELPHIPIFLSNYISKTNGSIFTLLPWFGYVAFGAFIATLFYRYLARPRFKPVLVLLFVSIGLFLMLKSSWLLMTLYNVLDATLLKEVAYYNYLFSRLGDVLLLFALFYAAESYLKQAFILKIGQKTLSIYVIHFILLYGGITGTGLYQIIGKTLTPVQAILGVLLFLVIVCFIAIYYVKTNAFVYSKVRLIIERLKTFKS